MSATQRPAEQTVSRESPLPAEMHSKL